MIEKEMDSSVAKDKFSKAGEKAERNMAFYLRREFAESLNVFVFNDLRLERNGEFAQIDHLVFHRYGFVIVESKSVTGKIIVNKHGEFERVYGRNRKGMQSPIEQAKLQAKLLRSLLNDHKEQLRRKILCGNQQLGSNDRLFRVLVAISDQGIIERKGNDPAELCKADSVGAKIKEISVAHERASGVTGLMRQLITDRKTSRQMEEDDVFPFKSDEQEAIVRFLQQRHTPRQQSSQNEVIVTEPVRQEGAVQKESTSSVLPIPSCRHCESMSLTIVYGRYGYYFKCQDCGGNTPVDFTCSSCGVKARVSKKGQKFTRVCNSCKHQELVYKNPA